VEILDQRIQRSGPFTTASKAIVSMTCGGIFYCDMAMIRRWILTGTGPAAGAGHQKNRVCISKCTTIFFSAKTISSLDFKGCRR
jgi:hypothetical protein